LIFRKPRGGIKKRSYINANDEEAIDTYDEILSWH